MPLTRIEVRNEFGLGDPELYRAASKDDSKAILDGVAVAGLVGVLRQLGDLAEFAAETFHDLHEQVTATAARSHKMLARVHRVEAALPPLEKAVFAQSSHLHFAYTPGSEWHADIQTKQNHLGHSDLPSFIMNSYEECRDPPRLFLLDKFDAAGAGACLKRYSDPSFFKTAWASSELSNAEKVKREKKARKSKKKVLHQINGEIQHAASISHQFGRIQLDSPDTDVQRFAAQTVSKADIRSTSELESRSMSPNAKPQLQFAEHFFDTSSSIEHEELENHDLSSSKLETKYNNSQPTIPLNEQNGEGEENDSSKEPLEGQSAPGSSSVTWYEKIEIVKPTRKLCESGTPQDQSLASETLPANFESKLVKEVASLSNNRQEDILFDVRNIAESYSDRNQSDEIVSETDNYVDALNTIESEIETDPECQTKREVKLQHNLKHQRVESGTGGMHDMDAQDTNSSDMKSPNCSHPVSAENLALAQPPEMTRMTSSLDSGLCGSPNAIDLSTVNGFGSVNGNPSSGFNVPKSQGSNITVISSKSQESRGTSNPPSINLWTNGSLLGLQPSKPPDFNASNVVSQNSTLGNEYQRVDVTNHNQMPRPHHDELVGKSSTSVKSIGRTERNSSVVGETDGYPDGYDLVDDNASVNGPELPCGPNIDLQSSESGQTNNKVSTNKSTINCNRPANGPLMEESPFHGNSSEPSVTFGADLMKLQERPATVEKKKHQNEVGSWTSHETTLREQRLLGSPENHISSRSYSFSHPSPPLEHMKISFHPMNGLETSILKLEFPNGHHHKKIIEDPKSPSFQLLPKLAIPLQEMGSESDDDTFYRSSPYPSDGLLSPHSESNSEQWESAEMTRSKDPEIYDALRRVPSTSSIASSSEIEGMTRLSMYTAHDGNSNAENAIQSVDMGPDLYLPSLNATNSLTRQGEANGDSNHPPPPLPPLQWRMAKPAVASAEDKQHKVSKVSNQPKDPEYQGPVTSKLPEPPQPKPPHFEAATASLDKGMQDRPKPNAHKDIRKAANGIVLDEREDFLSQIRTKSFSLRPTISTRPSLPPGPTTNNSVTAILEKANAIRQAFVGSDDGGDDENWSDG